MLWEEILGLQSRLSFLFDSTRVVSFQFCGSALFGVSFCISDKFPVPLAGSSPFFHLPMVDILYGLVFNLLCLLPPLDFSEAVCGHGFSWHYSS